MTRRRSSVVERPACTGDRAGSTPVAGSADWMVIVRPEDEEPKIVMHRTWNGRGVVGRLRKR